MVPTLADPFRLMFRPFAGYRRLAAAAQAPSAALGALRFSFVFAVFVALTATGRFVPLETFVAMVSFVWIPLVHAISLKVALLAVARDVLFRRALGLFYESLGPWLIVFIVVPALCLFAPEPARAVFFVLFPLLVVASAWCILLLVALFRAGLGLTRARTLAGTLVFYAVTTTCVVGYYYFAGQLWPIL
jgi:hypothetical protein